MRAVLNKIDDIDRSQLYYNTYNINGVTLAYKMIFKEAGIDPLKYVDSITFHDIYDFGIRNFSKYTNIKFIPDRGFYYTHSKKNIILPNSIITIGDQAFQKCRFDQYKTRIGYLQLYTYSLKQIGTDALSLSEGFVIIDTEKFDSNDPEFNVKIQDYFKSKGISYNYT